MKQCKTLLLATTLALGLATTVFAAGPTGFDGAQANSGRPTGFNHEKVMTVKEVKDTARDDQYVLVKGSFTKHLRGDKYEFTDTDGETITAELDDDYDWSHVRRGDQYLISAKVDKDWTKIKLEVKSARPAN